LYDSLAIPNIEFLQLKTMPFGHVFQQVKGRSTNDQFVVPDDTVRPINHLPRNIQLDWGLEIDNAGPAADATIANAFNSFRLAT
jgi:hypothetical protein